MTIRCVEKPKRYGFAHVCDACGAVGPIVGDSEIPLDVGEFQRANTSACDAPRGCSARDAGWHIVKGEPELCSRCIQATREHIRKREGDRP